MKFIWITNVIGIQYYSSTSIHILKIKKNRSYFIVHFKRYFVYYVTDLII
jgi:hypothetical protein